MRYKIVNITLATILMSLLVACGNRNNENAAVETDMNQTEAVEMEITSETGTDETQQTVETENNETLQNDSEENVLIAYFSLVEIVPDGADAVSSATPAIGNTEMAAMEIQKQVGGDLFAIKTENEYPVSHSDASAIAEDEMKSDERPVLTTRVENMEQYDTVYLGYPIWWYVEPMAIRTFLEEYDFNGKTIIPFCTSLGAGISESEEDIANLTVGATMKEGITLHTGADDFSEDIASWLSDIGMNE